MSEETPPSYEYAAAKTAARENVARRPGTGTAYAVSSDSGGLSGRSPRVTEDAVKHPGWKSAGTARNELSPAERAAAIVKEMAAGGATPHEARLYLARAGFGDLLGPKAFTPETAPAVLAEPPTRGRHWWRLTAPTLWAMLLKIGAINVLALDNCHYKKSERPLCNPELHFSLGGLVEVRDAEGQSATSDELLRSEGGERMYRVCAIHADSLQGKPAALPPALLASRVVPREAERRGQANPSAEAGRCREAPGFLSAYSRANGPLWYEVVGPKLRFTETASYRLGCCKHIPEALVDYWHALENEAETRPKPSSERTDERCSCWFARLRTGLLLEPAEAEDDE